MTYVDLYFLFPISSYVPSNVNQDQIYLVSEFLPQQGGLFISPMMDKENSQILQRNQLGLLELVDSLELEHRQSKIQNHKIIIGMLRYFFNT